LCVKPAAAAAAAAAAGRKTVKIPPGFWGIEGRHPPTVVVFGFRCCPQLCSFTSVAILAVSAGGKLKQNVSKLSMFLKMVVYDAETTKWLDFCLSVIIITYLSLATLNFLRYHHPLLKNTPDLSSS